MDQNEIDALCPLEETVRIVEPDHEWELLGKMIGVGLRDKSVRSRKADDPRTEDHPIAP